MTELLRKWAKVEPERCGLRGSFALVKLSGTEHSVLSTDMLSSERAIVLGAVSEAAEAHGWRLTLVHNPWREERPKWGAWLSRYEEGDLALARRDHEADTPAEAVLSAYLAALEAEAGQ